MIFVNKTKLNKLVKIIKDIYKNEDNVIFESLIKLLEIFREKFFIDFAFLADEEKINLIKDTFESNGLKFNILSLLGQCDIFNYSQQKVWSGIM